MDIVATKVLVAVLFGLVRLFFGLLPIKIYKCLKLWEKEDEGAAFISEKRHKQVNRSLALFQSFGGGVLFATCFLHMIPDVNKSVELLLINSEMTSKYPFAQVIVSIGFFTVYFVEEVSHWLITKMGRETRKNIQCHRLESASSRSPKENKVHPEGNGEQETVYIIDRRNSENARDDKLDENVKSENQKNFELSKEGQNTKSADFNEEGYLEDDDLVAKTAGLKEDSEAYVEVLEEVEQVKQLEKLMEKQEKDQQQVLRCCLVIVALSLHAIFEGLAIGLQISTSNIWYLFTAISIHSATILFCIGLELLIAKTKIKSIIVNIFILSITSPLGVLIGLLITLHANMDTTAKSVAVVLLEGLSAGTILYITFFEVLNREKARRVIILTRACFIIGGFILMAILEYVELGK